MKIHRTLAMATTAVMLGFVPAALAQAPSGSNHGQSQSSNAKKYGKFCQDQGKKHVKGQKGTPFSNCVKDLKKLSNGSATNPHALCASNETKKHVAGQKGTPYSDCVSAAAKLKDSQADSTSSSSTSSS